MSKNDKVTLSNTLTNSTFIVLQPYIPWQKHYTFIKANAWVNVYGYGPDDQHLRIVGEVYVIRTHYLFVRCRVLRFSKLFDDITFKPGADVFIACVNTKPKVNKPKVVPQIEDPTMVFQGEIIRDNETEPYTKL